jgi:hypothetical protein
MFYSVAINKESKKTAAPAVIVLKKQAISKRRWV